MPNEPQELGVGSTYSSPADWMPYSARSLDGYQNAALSTNGKFTNPDLRLAVLGLGLTGEAGEVADYLKKVVGHGHSLDAAKVMKELGDVLWYVAVLADAVGYSLSEVAAANVRKLKERYPDGFTTEASINRERE